MTVATAFAVSWKPLTNSKPERDQQRDPQQHERADRNRRRMGGIDVGEQTVQRVADADGQQDQ